MINEAPRLAAPTESLLAGSMAMALCYIARVGYAIAGLELLNHPFGIADKPKQTGWSENQLPDPSGHRKQRVRLAVHDLHECVFHRPKAERHAGRVRAGQTAQSSAAGLRHHRRTIPEAAPTGRISAVFAVGVPAGSTDAMQTGAASTGKSGLPGGLLLPPRTHRHRLRLLGLSVHLLQV